VNLRVYYIIDILSENSTPSSPSINKRFVSWNFKSETSMERPHVSGFTALNKPAHPNWNFKSILI
jgi:hypothetical protein